MDIKTSIPICDYVLAILGVFVCLYLLFNKTNIADRAGLPTTMDLFVSVGLIIALAVYRTLGLPLVIVASVFVLYVFLGLGWQSRPVERRLSRQSPLALLMQTEGVSGVAKCAAL